MQTLSQEDLEILRAILRKAFNETQVEALLTALAEWAARQEPKDLRKIIETLEQAVQGLRDEFREGLNRLETAVARLTEVHTRLEEALARLAEAQARTDALLAQHAERLARLEEGQQRLEEGQRRLEEALARLAEAQARTDALLAQHAERLARLEEGQRRLEEALARLTEAQARTDALLAQHAERLTRLEEGQQRLEEGQRRLEETTQDLQKNQRRLEDAITRLAEAQRRTERQIRQLAKQLGGLSDRLGGDLEDVAYIVIHDVLERERGWKVGVLERTWLRWNGREVEVDLFGQAADPHRPLQVIWIVAEVKFNLTLKEAQGFVRKLKQVENYLKRIASEKGIRDWESFPVCFCYRARPEVREWLRKQGIPLIFSYGRILWPEADGPSGPSAGSA